MWQGKGILKLIVVCMCLCAMSQRVMAQSDVQGNDSEVPRFKADNFGFNAIDIRQSRFLYGDSVEYRNRRFYDNMSLGMIWHFDKIHKRTPQGFIPALNYGIFIEKEINKLHSLRLVFYEGIYQQRTHSLRMNKYQAELLHSFNWTRFFGGYNPYRKVEAVTTLGVGGFYSKRLDEVELGPLFVMGAGARMQLSPAVSLGIEPYVALASDDVDLSGTENFRNYDVLYGGDVSLSYTFHEQKFKQEVRSRYAGRTFVDFGIGAQFEPFAGYYMRSSELPFFETAGPNLRLGIGHWLAPGLAIRATANLASSNLDDVDKQASHPNHDIRLKNVLANGRLDFLFSPYYYFAGREAGLFDINTLLGWEFGQTIKTAYDPADLLRTHYDGFSAGLQFRYNYDKNVSLYVEPRITLANYNVPYADDENYVDHYRDYLFSLTAGLEYAVNEYRFLGRKQQPSKFNPHISFAALGGPNYLFVTKEHASDFYVDYSAGLAGEIQITPYSGVRVMGDYSRLSYKDDALVTGKYGFVNLSADYVFDLGTMLQGYDERNRWDVALAAGPVYSRRVSEYFVSDGDTPAGYSGRAVDDALGVQVGIPVSFRLAPRWELLLEPRARFFSKDYITQGHSQGATKILNTQLGVRYSINDHYYVSRDSLDQYFEPKPGHLFAHMAVGAQTPQAWTDMGPRIEAGLGYWFNPGIAARASLNLASHDWKRYPSTFESSLRQMSASGRMDVMLDPFGYLANRYDRLFGLNLIAGWEYGMMLRGNMTETLINKYNAFSAGLQLRYNYDSYRSLYIEPRYTYNLTDYSSYYSIVAGMELGTTEYAFHASKRQPGEFSPAFSFSLLGGLGYIYDGKQYTDAPISNYSGGVAAEYKFSPYSGVRLTATYANYHQRGLYRDLSSDNAATDKLYNYAVDYMNLGLDYVFDVTTLLQGYTPDRKWNAALAVGPTFGYKVAQSEPAIRSGHAPLLGEESYSEEARESLWGVQVAVPVSYSINNNWDVVFEPRGKAAMDQLFNKRSSYPFMHFDALLGMKYTPDEHLYNRLEELNKAHDSRYDFVNYAMGIQYAAGTTMPFGATGGVHFGLGVGRWFNPLVGVRLGGEIAASHLNEVPFADYNLLLKSARVGARADVLLNPLAFISSYTPGRFGTALLLGWELGGKVDALYYTKPDVHFYNSFSVGAQLRYRTEENHTLYIEPRYAVDDRLVSVTAGLEYAMTDYRFLSGKRQPGEFSPYYNIGIAGGISHRFLTNMKEGMPQLGVAAGLSGEYHFTPYSGIRFTADYAEVTNGTTKRIGHLNTGFDYMFDLSTLFAGYTPDRRLGVSLAAGPVFSTRTSEDSETAGQPAESAIGAQVGVPVQYRLTQNFSLSLEPRAQAFFNRDYAGVGAGRSAIANLLMGVKYTPGANFYERMEALNESHDSRYDFVNYAMGLQYATGAGMPFGSTGGVQLGLGAGRWINPLVGVRFGAEIAASHLNSVQLPESELLLKSARFGGRADVMINPLAWSRSYTPGRFGTALLLGWELGGKIDAKYTHLDKHFYNSLSVGAQLRYHTDERHALYVEPRYTVDDRLVSVTAGLEYAMTEHRFHSSKRQPGEFTPHYTVGIAGGVNHLFLPAIYAGMPQLGAHVGMSGEYHFTPYSGFRMTLDYAQKANGMLYGGAARKYSVSHLNAGVDYMFDLSTLFAGYTPERRLDVLLAAGPVLTTKVAASDEIDALLDQTTLGVQLGIPVQYRLNSNWGISLEPRAQMFKHNKGLWRYFETYSAPYSTVEGGLTGIVNLQMGVKYTLGESLYKYVQESENRDYSRNFVNYSMGLQYATATSMPLNSTGGVQFGLGVGRWMNSLWGVRIGAEMAASHLNSVELTDNGLTYDLLLKSARIGGRADVLFNPLALGKGDALGRFGTALLLGLELGGKIDAKYTHLDKHFYNSLSIGAQLRYHTDELHALYIEPRYMFDDRLVSLTAGMEYAMSEYGFRSGRRQPGVFTPYYTVGLAGGVSHLFLPAVHAGMPQLGGNVGLSGEYHFSPYSGVRLTADYAQKVNGMEYGGQPLKYSVAHMNTGIDYMFDLSTLLAGYTPERRWDVLLAAGPVLSTRVSSNEELSGKFDRTTIGVQVGVPVQYHLNQNWGLSLEPRAQLFRIGFLNRLENYAAPYATVDGSLNSIANLQLGLKYTPGEQYYERMERMNESYDSRYDFVNYAMGLQYASGTGLPFGSTAGMHLGIGLGRWFNPLVGVRFGGEIASYHLRSVQLAGNEFLLKSARIGARADVLVNPLALSGGYTPGRFGTALLLGWEAGGKVDALYYTKPAVRFYNSLSVGAQLRMRTDENHTFYIEPRYAIDNGLVSMTAGLEYGMTNYRFRSGRRQPGEFSPYYNIGFAGGVSHRFITMLSKGMPQLGVAAGLSGEYHFTPYSGVRFTADYAEVTTGSTQRTGHVNTGFDYMFDLSTLFAGYTPARRLDVSLAAGPVFSTNTSESNAAVSKLARTSVGAQVGIPVQYRLTDSWGVSVEPRAQAFLNKDYAALGGGRSAILNVLAGVRYTPGEQLYRRMESLNETYGGRHSFVNYSMGIQYASGTGMVFGNTGGMQFGAGLGRWFNSLVGARLGAEMAAYHLSSVQPASNELLLKSARISGRVDMLVNPLALSNGYTPGRFGTALLLGWEAGGKIDALYYTKPAVRFYNSLSVGAQLRMRTDENHTFYVEPRYAFDNSLVSMTAGLEFAMTEHRFRSSKNQIEEFKPSYSLALAGGLSHRFLTILPVGMPQVGANVDLSGEYHFTPYSGARLTAGYAEVTNGSAMRVGHINTGVDYMFDLSTLFAGYTPERRLDVSLAMGPVFSMRAAFGNAYVKQLAKSSVGAQVGIPVQYRLTDNLGISLEPRAQAFFNRNYAGIGAGRSAIMNLLMGLKYSF